MPEMRQRTADTHREIRPESGATVLGLLSVSQVPNHAEPLARSTNLNYTHGVAMSVPTYDQFIEPILRYLAATPEGATARDAHEAAANALNLSEAQRQELIASGQATYKNRAGWAHDRLKRAGLSSSAKRGYWKLTD